MARKQLNVIRGCSEEQDGDLAIEKTQEIVKHWERLRRLNILFRDVVVRDISDFVKETEESLAYSIKEVNAIVQVVESGDLDRIIVNDALELSQNAAKIVESAVLAEAFLAGDLFQRLPRERDLEAEVLNPTLQQISLQVSRVFAKQALIQMTAVKTFLASERVQTNQPAMIGSIRNIFPYVGCRAFFSVSSQEIERSLLEVEETAKQMIEGSIEIDRAKVCELLRKAHQVDDLVKMMIERSRFFQAFSWRSSRVAAIG